MKEVFLTREISDNMDGYVDEVVNSIKAVPAGEELNMLITCTGGDTMQGDRIYVAIEEHQGRTKAIVIGCAISMGASLLPAFDEVEFDENIEGMLHSARPASNPEKLTAEQKNLVDRFNEKTRIRMLKRGVDADFVNKVFVNETDKNHWFSADEAEKYGLGKKVSVDRERNKNQFALAASLDMSLIKNESNNQRMSFLGIGKKATVRVVNLLDDRQVVFESKEENIRKGDKLALVNSEEVLDGRIQITNTLVADITNGEVVNMEEVEEPKAEISEDMIAELVSRVGELEDAVRNLVGNSEEGADEEKEEMEAKAKALEAKEAGITALMDDVNKTMASIKTTFMPPQKDDKREAIQTENRFTADEEYAIQQREFVKELNKG